MEKKHVDPWRKVRLIKERLRTCVSGYMIVMQACLRFYDFAFSSRFSQTTYRKWCCKIHICSDMFKSKGFSFSEYVYKRSLWKGPTELQ